MSVFVTGTDTGCGKTRVSCAILQACAAAGRRAVGMKPIATGAVATRGGLVNDDVEALAAASAVRLPQALVNPYVFEPPCSPHIAAAEVGSVVETEVIVAAFRRCQAAAEVVVVEGVGGWCVPVGRELWLEDVAVALGLPLVLVVGVKLGCINHAVLTARAMAACGLPLLGWIANILEPTIYARDDVLQTLSRHLPAPALGILEWSPRATARQTAPQLAAVARLLTPAASGETPVLEGPGGHCPG